MSSGMSNPMARTTQPNVGMMKRPMSPKQLVATGVRSRMAAPPMGPSGGIAAKKGTASRAKKVTRGTKGTRSGHRYF